MNNITIEILREHEAKGLLRSQSHPSLPLIVWNYTETVQYSGEWNELLLCCRGLITDDKGNIVATPLKKFFNIEEAKHIPTSEFVIEDKVDGSMLIIFNYNNQWLTATRGSFTSEQAVKGFEILKKNHPNYEKELDPNYTYIFEVLYPQNMIVVRYNGVEKLVWLGMIETKIGKEIDIYSVNNSLEKVKRYNFKDYTSIQALNWENSEGFVVKFSNSSKLKIKFEDYVRLHRIVTNTSSYTVWECLMSGGDFNKFLEAVPDEFYKYIKNLKEELENKYKMLELKAKEFVEVNRELDKKEFALKNLAENKDISGLIFSMHNGKDYSKGLWKMLKPEYSRPFSGDVL